MSDKPACLIIGAGTGNGLAIARVFGASGYRVLLASRRSAEMAKLAAELSAENIEASGHAMDAADPEGLAASIATLGPVDVLIYNVAGVTMAPPTALAVSQFAADLAMSVVSALGAAQSVAPHMIEAKRGTILFTGGGFALRPMAAMASLGVGKAAIRNLAFSLAQELGPQGIRVGTVTILGMVKPGTPFDPRAIADAFWNMHCDRDGKLGVEVEFAGA